MAIVQSSAALTPLTEIGFYEKLSGAIGQPVSTIAADNMAVMARVGRHLKNNSWVAMRVDSIPVHTNAIIISEVLGQDAAFPLNIMIMARQMGAALVPLFVFRKGRSYQTTLGRPVMLTPESSQEALQDAALKIDAEISRVILSHPGKYSGWPAVTEKWRMAEELLGKQEWASMPSLRPCWMFPLFLLL